MGDVFTDKVLAQVMTDCIIINKKDIEQLKKDVKALRNNIAKLNEIVNTMRKE